MKTYKLDTFELRSPQYWKQESFKTALFKYIMFMGKSFLGLALIHTFIQGLINY